MRIINKSTLTKEQVEARIAEIMPDLMNEKEWCVFKSEIDNNHIMWNPLTKLLLIFTK